MKAVVIKKAVAVILTVLLVLPVLVLPGCSIVRFSGNDSEKTVTEQTEQQVTQPETTVETGDTTGNDATTNNTEQTADPASGLNPGETTQQEQTGEEKAELPKVKALYLTGWTVGSAEKRKHYIELANTTEINAYVVDIKDDDGYVGYESQVPEVKEHGTWKKKYDPKKMLEEFHANGIYVIGRLVVFKDPVYSQKRPDLAVKSKKGGLWKDRNGLTWLNPYQKETWEYTVKIAKEAVELGFDEIQFDYVRFDSDSKGLMDFTGVDKEKYEAINEFLDYAKSEITEVPISADVFGIILESPGDTEKIGQYLELIGKNIDYICPMVYPSHYAYGQIVNGVKFPAPDLEPYAVVYNSLIKCKNRIAAVSSGYKAKVRPYLQDFTASWLQPKNGQKMYQTYGPEQVRQQIKAVYDAGYEEWILWDAKNTYSEEALLKE